MRSRVELVLRAIALAALAWLLIAGLRTGAPAAVRAGALELPDVLRRASTSGSPGYVHARFDGPVDPSLVSWLAALAATGVEVGWDAPGAQPIAAAADAIADPAGGTRVLVAAPGGVMVTLEDRWGPLDSIRADGAGARFTIASAPREVRVRAGGLAAHAVVRDSLALGRVLVLGGAGWESKFVAAALEERGWRADIDFALSPRGDVIQGRVAPLDVATHSAVIVLDTSASGRAGAIARFVAHGGGLIMAAPALASGPLAALAAGSPGTPVPAIEPFDTAFADPRRSLALTPIRPRADAVALERRGAEIAVAARRLGRGRIAVVGYDDTWRWRLAGSGEAPEAHRAWWATMVAAVAHSEARPLPPPALADEAPWAGLVDRLGPPAPARPESLPARDFEPWLFGLLLGGLLLEWMSRRLAGRR